MKPPELHKIGKGKLWHIVPDKWDYALCGKGGTFSAEKGSDIPAYEMCKVCMLVYEAKHGYDVPGV